MTEQNNITVLPNTAPPMNLRDVYRLALLSSNLPGKLWADGANVVTVVEMVVDQFMQERE